MGLMGLLMASYGGLWGILSALTKSTDHPSGGHGRSPCFDFRVRARGYSVVIRSSANARPRTDRKRVAKVVAS